MKNTILKFSLTALAALTLAACGSEVVAVVMLEVVVKHQQKINKLHKQLSQLKNRIIQVIQHQHLQTIKQVVL